MMNTAKRLLALLLCLSMVMGFAACGSPAAADTVYPSRPDESLLQREEQTIVRNEEQSKPNQENSGPVLEQTANQSVTDLEREDKELVVELIGGQDGSSMTDEELNEFLDQLIKEGIDSDDNQDAEPVPTEPAPTGPAATEPAPTEPAPTEPAATEPAPTEPAPTEPAPTEDPIDDPSDPGDYNDDGSMNKPFDEAYPEEDLAFSGESILIKMASDTLTEGLKAAGVGKLEMIVPLGDCAWYEAMLIEGTNPEEALAAVRKLNEVLLAEYNYEIRVAVLDDYKDFDEDKEEEFKKNGHNKDQWHFHHCGIVDGYNQMQTNGGDPTVVVAVIDSGVDYNHEDLKDNIWVNTAEIPDNGIDDDKNGYVDDYYGVDIVAGSGSGDDTNGHGTHVAGIIAARNNNVGVVGIAYNVKIMSVKAAAHNGTLSQADIAKAVLYAYEMGAEVINMSFGGTACSLAVQDALATAYTRCVLVASAGNDGYNNEPSQKSEKYLPNYPAALTYVLGVMSVDERGFESVFTNWDVQKYNGVEYELYAPGENIMSTLPGNQYGYLSGTSMAAPVVSAFAAILRSEFADRDKYPTEFIYGQLASTSDITADCIDPETHGDHNLPQIAHLYDALTKLPKPDLNVQDFAIFDDPEYSEKNNGNGVIDAGETIALGLTLRNRWGMSENTIVKINTISASSGKEDPYITIQNPEVDYGSVGTYSTQDCGKVYTGKMHTGWENPFLITISEDCPNDYRFTLNVTITCENGVDEADTETYTFKAPENAINGTVRSGYVLPAIIDEDMVLTADTLYIIPDSTVIREGVTVRVEPGTHIQFWSNDPADPYAEEGVAFLMVEGQFFVEGTKDNPVYIYPSELMSNYVVNFYEKNNGVVRLEYADITNLNKADNSYGISYAYGCTFRQNFADCMNYRTISNGAVREQYTYDIRLMKFDLAEKCVFYKLGVSATQQMADNNGAYLYGNFDTCIFVDCGLRQFGTDVGYQLNARNCVFLGNAATDASHPGVYNTSTTTINAPNVNLYDKVKLHYNPLTGTVRGQRN